MPSGRHSKDRILMLCQAMSRQMNTYLPGIPISTLTTWSLEPTFPSPGPPSASRYPTEIPIQNTRPKIQPLPPNKSNLRLELQPPLRIDDFRPAQALLILPAFALRRAQQRGEASRVGVGISFRFFSEIYSKHLNR